jgi:hypothetical protein
MAQDFENSVARVTGTTPVLVYTANSDDAVIGIRLTNVAGTAINVDCYGSISGNLHYFVKSAPLPVGSSLELIDGGSKINMLTTQNIVVVSDTAASLDTWISYIDAIST